MALLIRWPGSQLLLQMLDQGLQVARFEVPLILHFDQ